MAWVSTETRASLIKIIVQDFDFYFFMATLSWGCSIVKVFFFNHLEKKGFELLFIQWHHQDLQTHYTLTGLTIHIEVSNKMLGKTRGLCGNFDLDSTNDMVGQDGLQKETINRLAKSWIVNSDSCSMPDDPASQSGDLCKVCPFSWTEHNFFIKMQI